MCVSELKVTVTMGSREARESRSNKHGGAIWGVTGEGGLVPTEGAGRVTKLRRQVSVKFTFSSTSSLHPKIISLPQPRSPQCGIPECHLSVLFVFSYIQIIYFVYCNNF